METWQSRGTSTRFHVHLLCMLPSMCRCVLPLLSAVRHGAALHGIQMQPQASKSGCLISYTSTSSLIHLAVSQKLVFEGLPFIGAAVPTAGEAVVWYTAGPVG